MITEVLTPRSSLPEIVDPIVSQCKKVISEFWQFGMQWPTGLAGTIVEGCSRHADLE